MFRLFMLGQIFAIFHENRYTENPNDYDTLQYMYWFFLKDVDETRPDSRKKIFINKNQNDNKTSYVWKAKNFTFLPDKTRVTESCSDKEKTLLRMIRRFKTQTDNFDFTGIAKDIKILISNEETFFPKNSKTDILKEIDLLPDNSVYAYTACILWFVLNRIDNNLSKYVEDFSKFMKNVIKAYKSENLDLENQINSLNQTLEQLKNESQRDSKEVSQLKLKIEKLTVELSKSQKENRNQKKEIKSHQKKNQSFLSTNKELEKIKKEKQLLTQEVIKLKSTFKESNNENLTQTSKLQKSIQSFKHNNDRLSKELAISQIELGILKLGGSKKDQEILRLKKALESANKRAKDAQSKENTEPEKSQFTQNENNDYFPRNSKDFIIIKQSIDSKLKNLNTNKFLVLRNSSNGYDMYEVNRAIKMITDAYNQIRSVMEKEQTTNSVVNVQANLSAVDVEQMRRKKFRIVRGGYKPIEINDLLESVEIDLRYYYKELRGYGILFKRVVQK